MTTTPSIDHLIEKMNLLYAERDWEQFHSPKNLIMDLTSEIGELAEHFRWLTEEQSHNPEDLEKIREEIGDVFKIIVHIAYKLKINPLQAAMDKLDNMAKKYPVNKVKGLCLKYTKYKD